MLSILKRKESLIPHYYNDEVHEGKSYARDLRESLMRNPPKHKEAYFVFGEFSSVGSVEKALNYGYNANVLMGPKISEDSKTKVIDLKEKHKDKLKIYQSKYRPESHGMLFDNNLFFEDQHTKEPYKKAILIQNASKKEINYFIYRFNEDISILKEASLGDLQECPIEKRTTER